jgi:hypothetical protein
LFCLGRCYFPDDGYWDDWDGVVDSDEAGTESLEEGTSPSKKGSNFSSALVSGVSTGACGFGKYSSLIDFLIPAMSLVLHNGWCSFSMAYFSLRLK